MKKLMTLLCISLLTCFHVSAQSEQSFISTMEINLKALDTATSAHTYLSLANTFERIGKAEVSKWEPYYYAAFCYTMLASGNPDKSKTDMLAEKAEAYLQDAANVSADNSEINALHAMVLYIRVSVDPMTRWQAIGQEANAYLEKAKAQDPSNPRPYFIESRTKLRLPEGLGGGVQAALAAVNTSLEKFATFTTTGSIAPKWGKQPAQKFQQELTAKISSK